jgi:putative ABC transport system substrate-binding protein
MVIEARWADGLMERLAAIMAEVIGSKVDVLVVYGTQAAVAAKNATSTTPIVAAAMGEPLRTGLAASLARPGGNLTGTSVGWAEGIGGKWLELLGDGSAALHRRRGIWSDTVLARSGKRAPGVAPTRSLRLQLIEYANRSARSCVQQAVRKAQAVLVLPAPSSRHRWQVTALAAKYRLPTMYYLHDYVEAGGLIAYAPVWLASSGAQRTMSTRSSRVQRQASCHRQPTQWTLVVNLKTRDHLPRVILLRADEVIR